MWPDKKSQLTGDPSNKDFPRTSERLRNSERDFKGKWLKNRTQLQLELKSGITKFTG